MYIRVWQTLFTRAINAKFPVSFDSEQRLLALHRQVADVSQTLQFGEIGGVTLQTRIAGIFPDLLMLCEMHGVDLGKELPVVLDWFNSNRPKTERT